MNTEIITGRLDADETIELGKACLENMTMESQIDLIKELCRDDEDFTDELVAHIEDMQS